MIPITKWAGLVTNASQYAIPPGAAVEQVNLQCLTPGQLSVRRGMSAVTFAAPTTTTVSIVRAFRYQHGSGEHIVYQDADGRIYSSAVSASTVTAGSPPSAPVVAAALPGDTTISVSLTPPTASGGSPVTGYAFQLTADDGATWSAAGSSSAATYTLTGLTNGVAYRVRAAAANVFGAGDFSAAFGPVSPRAPSVGPASPPGLVAASAAAANSATVSWYTPSDNGGSAITGYTLQKSADLGLTWSAAAQVGVVSTATVAGLDAGTDFVFRVAAITAYGTGQYSASSNSVSITGSSSTPSQPQNLSGLASTSSVTLSWGAPASTGGSAITGYTIRYGSSAQGPWTIQAASGLTGTVSGLSPNSRYTFGVYASNANGAGQIASVDVTTLATAANTAPSAPTNLTLTATADGFSATWDQPANNGGSAITAYRVTTASSATGPETQVYNNLARSYTATGLAAGSTVWVSVYAVNAVGSSFAMRSNVTVGLAPSAPRNFTATPTSAQVVLSWSAPASLYGQPVTAYILNYGGEFGEQVAGNSTTKTVVPIQGQPYVAGASYTYTVAAVTAAGTGAAASVTFTVPDAPAVLPSPPQNLVLTPRDGGFTATWDAPASSGSSPIARYAVFYNPPAAWSPELPATARTATISGLTNGKAVGVYVYAYTAVGSAVATGTVTPYGPATPPYALSYSVAWPSTGVAQVTLSWTPGSSGGLAVTKYIVYRDGYQLLTTSNTSVTVSQAASSATYAVAAETAAGATALSNVVTVAASAPSAPQAPALSLVSSSSGQLQFIAYSAGATNATPFTYVGQFSLDNGATWQSASSTLSAIEGGGVKFACDVPYAGAASRAVLGRARASVSYSGTAYTSDWSTALSASVTFSGPTFTPVISAVDGTGQQIRVSWTAAAATGGAPLTKYTVRYKGRSWPWDAYDVSPSTLSTTILRRDNEGDVVEVVAVNAVGSTTASLNLPLQFTAPRSLEIQATQAGLVYLRWVVPQFLNGRTVAEYEIARSADQNTWTVLTTTASTSAVLQSQPLGTLSAPVYYRVVAVATNADRSGPSIAYTPALPSVVLNVSLASSGDVGWSAPTYDGGVPITSYLVEYKVEPTSPAWKALPPPYVAPGQSPPRTAFVPVQQLPGTWYVRVSAVNGAGQGPSSYPVAPS